MCGLVGVAGNITAKDKDAFRTLLVLDTIRGPHSTGVASIDRKASWEVVKKKGNAWDLFDSREYTSMMSMPTMCLIGHNRYATKGKINNINAHPFEFEHVVGVHNGTIRGQHRLMDHQKFEVDSENIYHSINEIGLDETLDVLDGAYALVYWDKRTEQLAMVRNSERSLYYTMSPDNQTVYWASEAWMLTVSLSRAGVKHGEVVDVRPLNVYRFAIDKAMTKPEPIAVSLQGFIEFKPPLPVKHSYHRGTVPQGNGRTLTETKKSQPSKDSSDSGSSFPALQNLVGTVVEFVVEGHKQNAHKQWFVCGKLAEFPEVEVRVFTNVNSDLWNRLTVCYDSLWEGEINSFAKAGDNGFVTLKPATVMEIVEDEDEEEADPDTFVGYNNKLLTEEQFFHATSNGCSWCSDSATVFDAKYIYWLGEREFVCADCAEVDDVKTYIQMANG